MSDGAVLTLAWLILAAHVVALAFALFGGRRVRPLMPVNIGVAAIALTGVAARGRYLFAPPDWLILALAAAELGVIAVSIAAWRRGSRPLAALAGVAFTLHLLATIALLLFLLTFRMDRLI